MAKVILRQEAINDLNNIWEYTYHQWSEKKADRYYFSIKLVCQMIGQNPNLGKEYKSLMNDLYGLKSGKHVIFYKFLSNEEIEIVRILHERMDLKSRF